MLGIILSLLAPVLYGFTNILDNYLANKVFKNIWTLAFLSVSLNALFLPLVWLVETPGMIPLSLVPFCLLIGLIEMVYPYPYYKALQLEDTSIVSSLFAFGKIFLPLFAFLLVGEQLLPIQYAGCFLIVISCAALTLTDGKSLRFNTSLYYMVFCSVILSLEAVIYKYLFEQVSWSTGFVWTTVFTFLPGLTFLLMPAVRRDLSTQLRRAKANFGIFALEEFFAFGGHSLTTYAMTILPVTVVKSIEEVQPIFVLLTAVLLGRFFPKLFREEVDKRSLQRKFFFFVCIIVGIILVSPWGFE